MARKQDKKTESGQDDPDSADTCFVTGPIGREGENSFEEWLDLRSAAYRELLKFDIPDNVVAAVLKGDERTAVKWETATGETPKAGDRARCIVSQIDKMNEEQLREYISRGIDKRAFREATLPSTAGEALAMILSGQLAHLRNAKSSSVRSKELLARSTIASIAVDLLQSCQAFEYAPGVELMNLIRELLDADRPKLKHTRAFESRRQAVAIAAQTDVGARELSRMVGVNVSTASRWLKEPEFIKSVQSYRDLIEKLKKLGKWPPKESDSSS